MKTVQLNIMNKNTCHSDRSGGIFVHSCSIVTRFLHFVPKAFGTPIEITLLALLLFISFNSFASVTDNYNKANGLYDKGNYTEAIEIYEQLIAEDNLSTDIYFNLGNAHYKNEEIPQAILSYERALKLKPDNEDALFNLKMANKKTIDKIDRLPELFIANTWRTLVTSRTVDNWAYYAVGLVFLSLVFFMTYLLSNPVLIKKVSFYSGMFFLAAMLFCWLMAAQHKSINVASSEAIIFEPTVTILSAPNTSSEKLFTLHEGTKIKLLETTNEWSKIKLPNGNVGWIKVEVIEVI